ncbi:hypothetical protein VRC00_18470 [Erwinia aphidicola]|uniref:hypothetical protein n=1 Tax=Erwinia aphidicola TaxID=68334 RepID=UPI0030CCD6C7
MFARKNAAADALQGLKKLKRCRFKQINQLIISILCKKRHAQRPFFSDLQLPCLPLLQGSGTAVNAALASINDCFSSFSERLID